jgi:integrase
MASLIKHSSGTYYIQFYDEHKRPRRKRVSLGTKRKRVAGRAFAKREEEYILGRYDPWAPPEPPEEEREDLSRLGDAKDAYLASCAHLKPATIRTYREIIDPFTDHLGEGFRVSRIKPKHVLGWLDTTDANDVTRRKYVSHLGYLFRFLVERGWMKHDISKDVPLRKVPEQAPKAMTPEQVAKLVNTIHAYTESRRDNPRVPDYTWLADVVEANVHLGLRRAELIHLKWSHVDLEERKLRVVNTGDFTTKSGRQRTLPLSEQALGVLQKREDQREGEEYVFNSHRGGRIDPPDYLSWVFMTFRRRAELPEHFSFHSTRHTFGTWLAERGVPVTVIQSLMGHSSVTTTERYMSTRVDVAEQWVGRVLE